jgi:hypothetical protein
MPVPFSNLLKRSKPGFRTPDRINPKTGRPDTIPSSARGAVVVASPTDKEKNEIRKQQEGEELQLGFSKNMRDAGNEADFAKLMNPKNNPFLNKGGRRTRKSRKSRRRRTRKH